MRAVIQDRIHEGISSANANTLYFGCRSASKDEHYGDEWAEYAREGKMTYRAAFSRDGPEGKARTYVQDLVREDAARIWELVGEKGAWVYISGCVFIFPGRMKCGEREERNRG